jgi:DNA repair protein RecN (Recombination protein N)
LLVEPISRHFFLDIPSFAALSLLRNMVAHMIRELSVQNLALIEDVRVDLEPGFCAWTGETGAGKTLLLEALGLLLGERGSVDLLRSGADELQVAARFDPSAGRLAGSVEDALGMPLVDGELVLSRRLTSSGRSYSHVNGQPVALQTLRRLRGVLVDIHGQHESQALLEPIHQLRLLDAFGGLQKLRDQYDELVRALRTLRNQHSQFAAERQARQRELALLHFEREELDSAELKRGEMTELARQRQRLAHQEALLGYLRTGCTGLYDEDGSVFEQLSKLAHEGEKWAELDPALAETARRLSGLAGETQDLAETLRDLMERWHADPGQRDQVEERFQTLRRLETKYGKSTDELVDYRARLDGLQAQFEAQETSEAGLRSEISTAFERLREIGAELSHERRQAAKRLTTAVAGELADLGMAAAKLEAVWEEVALGDDPVAADIPGHGFERLELMLSANPGEPLRPLRKVASGGELSRTMLALKTVLAALDEVGTLVFDEIDANVGGRLGDVLGEKLAALGKTHQVICVTHLPQVASFAPHQWSIRKTRHGKRMLTSIQLLGHSERLDELATMLRGQSRGETTRKEAEAMLAAARPRW